jgi:hypothetical protein
MSRIDQLRDEIEAAFATLETSTQSLPQMREKWDTYIKEAEQKEDEIETKIKQIEEEATNLGQKA